MSKDRIKILNNMDHPFYIFMDVLSVCFPFISVTAGIAPARHPVDPKKSNRVLELSSSNYGSLSVLRSVCRPQQSHQTPLPIELSSRSSASPGRRRAKHHSSLGMAGSGQQPHRHHL